MIVSEVLEQLGLAGQSVAARELLDRLPRQAPQDWRTLATALALRLQGQSGFLLGIGGGQGAGKTTLARLLAAALGELGRRSVTLSLDDFYLGQAARRRLAEQVHPLLATRGVPGTHDVQRALSVLGQLKAGGACRVPVFDKAIDDLRPPDEEPELGPNVDVVIFEGWCLGAAPQQDADLIGPCNELEATEDPDGSWRRFVNRQLEADYAQLWALVDELLYLQVPGMAAVLRWRGDQESQHPAEQRMDPKALQRFVAHFERLTRWMDQCLPATAQLVAVLDTAHCLQALRVND